MVVANEDNEEKCKQIFEKDEEQFEEQPAEVEFGSD
jgi:hypothetical protein